MIVEESPDRARLGKIGKAPEEAGQQPVSVDARVPVETAVKNRAEPGRRLRVARPLQNMAGLVRIFASHMAERHGREAGGDALVEPKVVPLCHDAAPKSRVIGAALVETKRFGNGRRALVELRGIEPLTSAVRLQRSPI